MHAPCIMIYILSVSYTQNGEYHMANKACLRISGLTHLCQGYETFFICSNINRLLKGSFDIFKVVQTRFITLEGQYRGPIRELYIGVNISLQVCEQVYHSIVFY